MNNKQHNDGIAPLGIGALNALRDLDAFDDVPVADLSGGIDYEPTPHQQQKRGPDERHSMWKFIERRTPSQATLRASIICDLETLLARFGVRYEFEPCRRIDPQSTEGRAICERVGYPPLSLSANA